MASTYPPGFEDIDFGEFRSELLERITENETVDLRIAELRNIVAHIVSRYPPSKSSEPVAE
jgi:hypothetical protein